VKKRSRLRLVSKSERDATGIFDDMDQLRADFEAPPPATPPEGPLRTKRAHETETFARIPHDRALELYKRLDGAAWVVLIELDHIVFSRRHRNPVTFWSKRLRDIKLTQHTRYRALRQLEAAGVVKITSRGKGFAPLVTHLWYPLRE
jgi:hypothetical protein